MIQTIDEAFGLDMDLEWDCPNYLSNTIFQAAEYAEGARMRKIVYTYWRETDGKYLGYLNEYPDHWTQGNDLDDLKEHLIDLNDLFAGEEIPGIKRVAELEVA